jgi:hypothetical protein
MNFLARHHYRLNRLFLILVITTFCLTLSGCTTIWTATASALIPLIGAAGTAFVGILTALGSKVAPEALAAIQTWQAKFTAGLAELQTLITQYKTAPAASQPGLIGQIETVAKSLTGDLPTILPTLNIKDANTQARVEGAAEAITGTLDAFLALIPVIKGSVTPMMTGAITEHGEVVARLQAAPTPKSFQNTWNHAVDTIAKAAPEVKGKQFHVGHNRVVGALEKAGDNLGNAVGKAKFGG